MVMPTRLKIGSLICVDLHQNTLQGDQSKDTPLVSLTLSLCTSLVGFSFVFLVAMLIPCVVSAFH